MLAVKGAVQSLLGEPADNDKKVPVFQIIDDWITSFIQREHIEVVQQELWEAEYYGKLVPTKNTFTIFLRKPPSINPHSIRFTLAHELGHILAYTKTNAGYLRGIKHSQSEEIFCDAFAREVLLPSKFFRSNEFSFETSENQIHTLNNLAAKFKVFHWQIVKKIAEENYRNTYSGIYWVFSEKEKTFRIIDKFSPYGIFIPHSDRLFVNEIFESKNNQVANDAFALKTPLKSTCDIKIGSLYDKLNTTVLPFIEGKKKFLIQLIELNEKLIEKSLNWRNRKQLW